MMYNIYIVIYQIYSATKIEKKKNKIKNIPLHIYRFPLQYICLIYDIFGL